MHCPRLLPYFVFNTPRLPVNSALEINDEGWVRDSAVNQKDHSVLEQKGLMEISLSKCLILHMRKLSFSGGRMYLVAGSWQVWKWTLVQIFFSCLWPLHETVFMKNTVGSSSLGTVFSEYIFINLTESKCKSIYKRERVSFISHMEWFFESHVTKQKAKNGFLGVSGEWNWIGFVGNGASVLIKEKGFLLKQWGEADDRLAGCMGSF